MSLTRQFFREIRPFFRMIEEPLRPPSLMGMFPSRIVDDPLFRVHSPNALRPAVDLSEEGNAYVVEAELPGVKRENIEVRIGDGGRSVTIEGKTYDRGENRATTKTDEPAPSEGTSRLSLPCL
jgi:HSP20 family molecular chaperone IbpA